MAQGLSRLALLLLATSQLSGCAGMLAWDAPEKGRRSTPGLVGKRPPPDTVQAGTLETAEEKGRGKAAGQTGKRPETFPVAVDLPPVGEGEYRVQRGDTLYSIAFRNNLDFRELARWNGIGSDYVISVNQVLRLKPPPAGAVVAAAPKPAVPATPLPKEVPAAMPALPDGFEWTWPTQGKVTRAYAPGEGAKGLDIAGELGQPIFAAAPGRVVYSGNALKGYGELIIIKHDEVHLSAYGYNRKRHVVEGDVVTSGQPIGELGLGPENKPLLHFELRAKGKPVNPAKFLPKQK